MASGAKIDGSAGGKKSAMPRDDGASPRREIVLDTQNFDVPGDDSSFVEGSGFNEVPEAFTPAPDSPEKSNPDANSEPNTKRGVEVLLNQLKTMPFDPGVYRMLDKRGEPIYVGKAKRLKSRVRSYTQLTRLPVRLQRMVAETHDMEIVVTNTEVEALLLESNLIKRFSPKYNVLLRDDKSFPYIKIGESVVDDEKGNSTQFPRLTKHRGQQEDQASYFGPFASAGAVTRTLNALEKAFLLRSCSDHVFDNRTRPCLLYQIKRCSAPCVGLIKPEDYASLVNDAKGFLTGSSSAMQRKMAEDMQQASEALEFERAARLRDRIRALTSVQSTQDINHEGQIDDADVVAIAENGGQSCIQVFFFRAGRNYGNRSYFPSHHKAINTPSVLAAFLAQFYDNKPPPKTVLTSIEPKEAPLLADAFSLRANRRVQVLTPQRGPKRNVVDMALSNAKEALARRQAENATQKRLLEGVRKLFGIEAPVQRIEVYDNSHLQGTDAYGAMIVAGEEGLQKASYRKWKFTSPEREGPNIQNNDFAMMEEVFRRRFKRALKEREANPDSDWPDIVLIDGGKGQLSQVLKVIEDLGVQDVLPVAIAKGSDRDAGREVFHLEGRQPFQLPPSDPVLYFLQRLRDEAHRFAIGSHRAKRSKNLAKSLIDEIAGIGPKRKKLLLQHFGSAKAVAQASHADLQKVDGISSSVAEKIQQHFKRD